MIIKIKIEKIKKHKQKKSKKHLQINLFDHATQIFDQTLFIKINFLFNQTLIEIDTHEVN